MGRTREVARRTIHEGGQHPPVRSQGTKRSRPVQQNPVPVTSDSTTSGSDSEESNNTYTNTTSSSDDSTHEVQSTASGTAGFTMSDPTVFNCPICTNPLTIPVYQCEDGHFSCKSCCDEIGHMCPTCDKPIGNKRCKGMESILESIVVSCKNMERGCTKKFSFWKKLDHENSCKYTPIPCPCVGCEYVGVSKSFYDHYADVHLDSCKFIEFNKLNEISVGDELYFLLERKEKKIFFLHRIVDPVGSFVCVSTASNMKKFSYDLTVGSGMKSVNMKSFVEVMPNLFANPAKEKCLLITKNVYPGASNETSMLRLQLVIRKVSL